MPVLCKDPQLTMHRQCEVLQSKKLKKKERKTERKRDCKHSLKVVHSPAMNLSSLTYATEPLKTVPVFFANGGKLYFKNSLFLFLSLKKKLFCFITTTQNSGFIFRGVQYLRRKVMTKTSHSTISLQMRDDCRQPYKLT